MKLKIFSLLSITLLLLGSANLLANRSDQQAHESTAAMADGSLSGRGAVAQVGLDEVKFVPGEVLLKFRDARNAERLLQKNNHEQALSLVSSARLTEIFERFDVKGALAPFKFARASSLRDVLKLTSESLKHDSNGTQRLIAELRSQPEVDYAEPNRLMRVQTPPNDPYYSSSQAWGQNFRDLWGLQSISADAAWNTSTGENVVVAVSDSGVDYNHEDLAANIWQNFGELGNDALGHDKRSNGIDDDANGFVDDWRGYDFVTLDGTPTDNDPMDDNGHGTHVAGTIAAIGNNGVGIVGVAYGSKVMAVRGIGSSGVGSIADLAGTILYAADNGAKVINASWGEFFDEPDQTLISAIAYAHDVKGVVVVVAAGNNNSDVGTESAGFYPACIRNVITVGAVDHLDSKASFSNFGSKLDLSAPGGGDVDPNNVIPEPHRSVLSLLSSSASSGITSSGELIVGAKYLRQAGTSMAAPHAAGIAALVRSVHPEFSPEQVRQVLHLGVNDLGAAGFDDQFGYGRANATTAVSISSPLAVQLTSPTDTITGTCSVAVRGTAMGPGFATWRLEFGPGNNPVAWSQISLSTNQFDNTVFATWDISAVADGSYTLRLTAENLSGQRFEDRMLVKIDNAFITEPQLSQSLYSPIFRSGTPVEIRGSASGCSFALYRIKIKRGTDGQFLTNPLITIPDDGTTPVENGLLGTWNTAGLPADYYQIVLEVVGAVGTIQKTIRIIIDPDLHPGWPINLGLQGSGFFSLSIAEHLDIADLDGDGAQDIVVAYGNSVRIFNHEGGQLPGWPQTIDPLNNGLFIQKSPVIGDLDGDGRPEVVAADNDSHIFVWHSDGSSLSGWPKVFGGNLNSLAIADINGDKVNDVIATDWWGQVKVFDVNGEYLPGWPKVVSGAKFPILTTPCIADLDRDGNYEIITTDGLSVYVLDHAGTLLPGWPRQIANTKSGYVPDPAVGDISGDERFEIVVSGEGRVYALNSDSTDVPGWPQLPSSADISAAAIGDIDGDGRSEVVLGAGLSIYAWHGNGSLLDGWPVTSSRPDIYRYGSPALADIDADQTPEIIIEYENPAWTNLSGPFALSAFRFDKSSPVEFPKPTISSGASTSNTSAIGDIDNDGLLEVTWIDREANLYVWDLTTSSTNLPWPMYHHDPQHTGTNAVTSSTIQFLTATTLGAESAVDAVVTVVRTGNSASPAAVDYITTDTDNFTFACTDTVGNAGSAFARCDYATSLDTITFGSGETSKTFIVPIIDDAIVEGTESFQIGLQNPKGAMLGTISTATVQIIDNDQSIGPNPIFNSPFFVRLHYLDFLSREPEPAGFNAWLEVLKNCSDVNNNPLCDRVTVSSSFFGSQEFQLKGFYVFRFYKLAFGRLPLYQEVVVDMRGVTGTTPEQVYEKKAAFANTFIQRSEFLAEFSDQSNGQFVAALLGRYQIPQITTSDPTSPDSPNKVTLTATDLINGLNAGTLTRAHVLRAIADSDQVLNAEFNSAFVAMQYYGYLRRTPENGGYQSWLAYLNEHPTDFRTMVNGFVNSVEYRMRFGQP